MSKKNILIIDDDKELVDMLKIRLEANDYEVITAIDGLVGLEKANSNLPDLILLDIKMAQVDGYTVLRTLKHNEKTKHIPVIVLTGFSKMRDLFDIEGVSDYVVKPFEDQDLLLRISRAIKS